MQCSWAPQKKETGLLLQDAFGLRSVGCDGVHERGVEAVVGLELQLLQAGADGAHLFWLGARFDDGGDESGEVGGGPAGFLRQLGMHEIEAVERMRLVLDAAVHVDATAGAGMTLKDRKST